jgi:hypothetical protein
VQIVTFTYLGKPVGKEGTAGLETPVGRELPAPAGVVTVPPEVEGMLGTLGTLVPVGALIVAGLDIEPVEASVAGLTLVVGAASGLVTAGFIESLPPDVPVVASGVVLAGVAGVLMLVLGVFLTPDFLFFFRAKVVLSDTVET